MKILSNGETARGIIIPKAIMEGCNFRINEPVSLEIVNKELVIRPTFRHRTLEERAKDYGGKLGDFTEVDWGKPLEGEVW